MSSFTPDELAELRPIFSSISHHSGSVGAAELFPVLKSINRSAYSEAGRVCAGGRSTTPIRAGGWNGRSSCS